ncbi:uncharacterized protein LOC132706046 [Cylas formicarius]|uniref:uncharacterized protein LOC132706046 n=1 Tax=Cylas formicarius TaxID=197179 RepID=UPI0029584414|nr:uncharacterized protein LOC132706046 [Cylas formicarius]
MAPPKRKCCVPLCSNVEGVSTKQFFKVGANMEERQKWLQSIGSKSSSKGAILCCEDHFRLTDDAENYIRYKYVPGTKLQLRSGVLPSRNIPIKVCRICLKTLDRDQGFEYLSEKRCQDNADIMRACLPEIDLSVTVDPVACLNCFTPLKSFYKVKEKALKTEVTVIKCVKFIMNKFPHKLTNAVNLFDNYDKLQELLNEEDPNENADESVKTDEVQFLVPQNDSKEGSPKQNHTDFTVTDNEQSMFRIVYVGNANNVSEINPTDLL